MSQEFDFRVLVSVVNYCSAELVCQMLPELVSQIDVDRDRIIIVDNQSSDDSVNILNKFIELAKLHDFVKVIPSEKNGGFSYGNNLALQEAIRIYTKQPEYVWLLNPDTMLLNGALDNLIAFFSSHPTAGILGSRLEHDDGTPQGSAFRFHSIISEFLSGFRWGKADKFFARYLVSPPEIYEVDTQVDWVAGASMFVRQEVFDESGLMDESYFLYFEETDFCLQAKKSGWQCWYVPESRVIHYVGQSTGVVSGDSLRRRRPKYWFKSRQHYFRKNSGLLYTVVADCCWILGFSILKTRQFVLNKKSNDPKYMLRDFVRHSILLSWWT